MVESGSGSAEGIASAAKVGNPPFVTYLRSRRGPPGRFVRRNLFLIQFPRRACYRGRNLARASCTCFSKPPPQLYVRVRTHLCILREGV